MRDILDLRPGDVITQKTGIKRSWVVLRKNKWGKYECKCIVGDPHEIDKIDSWYGDTDSWDVTTNKILKFNSLYNKLCSQE